jgi:hypothetical protein
VGFHMATDHTESSAVPDRWLTSLPSAGHPDVSTLHQSVTGTPAGRPAGRCPVGALGTAGDDGPLSNGRIRYSGRSEPVARWLLWPETVDPAAQSPQVSSLHVHVRRGGPRTGVASTGPHVPVPGHRRHWRAYFSGGTGFSPVRFVRRRLRRGTNGHGTPAITGFSPQRRGLFRPVGGGTIPGNRCLHQQNHHRRDHEPLSVDRVDHVYRDVSGRTE